LKQTGLKELSEVKLFWREIWWRRRESNPRP